VGVGVGVGGTGRRRWVVGRSVPVLGIDRQLPSPSPSPSPSLSGIALRYDHFLPAGGVRVGGGMYVQYIQYVRRLHGVVHPDYGLRTIDCGLRIADCVLVILTYSTATDLILD